jgi:hypothetical protein
MRELLIVPSIRSREIASAQRSRVGHHEDAPQPLDFSDVLFSIHPSPSSKISTAMVKRDGIN